MSENCGPRLRMIPEGDDRERLTCPDCNFIFYENPKIVSGALILSQNKVLLCKRAIEPRRGYWTLPAGFLELEESPDEGAARECWEEARAKIKIHQLLSIYTVRKISQVQMFYLADLLENKFEAGPESLDARLFSFDEIPWSELAFPTVQWTLEHYLQYRDSKNFPLDCKVAPHRVVTLTQP